MKLYNIYDFLISVEGPAVTVFSKEFEWAQVDSVESDINLYVKPFKGLENLPTRPAGQKEGFLIPFGTSERTFWYNEGTTLEVLLSYVESLLWWPEKTLLHASAVAKDGEALLFTGTGNVGKTSIVLNLLKLGYEYLSDDWVVVSHNMAYSFPKTIHIFDYNLRNSEIARLVLGRKRFLYWPLFAFWRLGRDHSPHRFLRYGFESAKPIFHVQIDKIHPQARIADPTTVGKVFYLERRNVEKTILSKDIAPSEVARRLAFVNLYERDFFLREYYKYAAKHGAKDHRVEDKYNHDLALFDKLFNNVDLYRFEIPRRMDLTKVDLLSKLGLN